MSIIFDSMVAGELLKLLTVPWEDTDAYQLGLIDEDGNILVKRSGLRTSKEKNALTIFHVLVWNIRKLIAQLPGGKSRIASLATALWLLKESKQLDDWNVTDDDWDKVERLVREWHYKENPSESQFHSDAPIKPGRYMVGESSFRVDQPVESIGRCLGVPLFKLDGKVLAKADLVKESSPSSERTFYRITDRNGMGLMNNQALDRGRLSDDEVLELIDVLDFGLQQPANVPSGSVFYFTDEGMQQHKRLIQLLKKASRNGFKIQKLTTSNKPLWESDDGQVAFAPKKESTVQEGKIDQTETPEFKRWFGNSKVVDRNGKPLMVYHGTGKSFTSFSHDGNEIKTDQGIYGRGFYFTPDWKMGDDYAVIPKYEEDKLDAIDPDTGEKRSVKLGGSLMPVYLSISNPLEISIDTHYDKNAIDRSRFREKYGYPYSETDAKKLTDTLISDGYDGVIIHSSTRTNTEYVAFYPEQIKSAIGNRGTFDPSSSNINESTDLLQERKNKDGYDWSAVLIDLPSDISDTIKKMADRIDEGDVDLTLGISVKPHVTVIYGLDDKTPKEIEDVIESFGPVTITFGKTSIFDENPAYDVVKIDVESDDLKKLRKEILGEVDAPGNKFAYHPHATVSYVLKGTGKKYVGWDDLDGKTVTLGKARFSSKDGPQTIIPLVEVGPQVSESVVVEVKLDQTETPEFKRWFGNSKVVDDNDRPLVVYKAMYPYDYRTETDDHPGTEITSINRPSELPAFNNGETGVKIAGFFGDLKTANRFASESAVTGKWPIYPVYLSFQNPYVMDAGNSMFAGEVQFGSSGKEFRDAIRSGKYDSVIVQHTKDEGTIYVALSPEQIKSATGNRGTFDPNSSNINESSHHHTKKVFLCGHIQTCRCDADKQIEEIDDFCPSCKGDVVTESIDYDDHPKSVAGVNRMLKEKGFGQYTLRRNQYGSDHFFVGPDTSRWFTSSTFVYRVYQLTYQEWWDLFQSLYEEGRKGIVEEEVVNAPTNVVGTGAIAGTGETEGDEVAGPATTFGKLIRRSEELVPKRKKKKLVEEASGKRMSWMLKGLAAEAMKCDSFEQFEKDYIDQIKHGLYYHWTDHPDFTIDLEKGPTDRSSMAGKSDMQKGALMITSHLSNWDGYGNRKYVAIIDMSEVPREKYYQVKRGFGNEFYVTDPSKAKVIKVVNRKQAYDIDRRHHKLIPQSQEELLKFYNEVKGTDIKIEDISYN